MTEPVSFRAAGDVTIATLHDSEITLENFAPLSDKLLDLTDRGRAVKFVLDLSSVVLLGSIGLTQLVILLKRVSEAGGAMAIADLSAHPLGVLKVMNLTKVFDVYGGVDAAGAALARREGNVEESPPDTPIGDTGKDSISEPLQMFSFETTDAGTIAVLNEPEISSEAADVLRAGLAEAVAAGSSLRFVLDVSAMTFLGSVGIGALLGFLKETKAAGGNVALAGLTADCRSVGRVSNVDRAFVIAEDVPSAFEKLIQAG